MNIYFAGSISGGRAYLSAYQKITAFIKSGGHHILTEHVTAHDVLEKEDKLSPEYIYNRDVAWIRRCDAMVAEVSNPSLGVGYEICYALSAGKRVLCLYEKQIFLSRMLRGNRDPLLTVYGYHDENDWRKKVAQFLIESNGQNHFTS